MRRIDAPIRSRPRLSGPTLRCLLSARPYIPIRPVLAMTRRTVSLQIRPLLACPTDPLRSFPVHARPHKSGLSIACAALPASPVLSTPIRSKHGHSVPAIARQSSPNDTCPVRSAPRACGARQSPPANPVRSIGIRGTPSPYHPVLPHLTLPDGSHHFRSIPADLGATNAPALNSTRCRCSFRSACTNARQSLDFREHLRQFRKL